MNRISNIRDVLLKTLYSNLRNELLESVLSHPKDFQELYNLIKDTDTKVSWRAAWICEKISEIHPEWFAGKENELISLVAATNHDGTKRELLSILYNLPIPETFPIELLDFCLNHMLDLKESIAVQALCVKIAYKLCKKEPELKYELKLYLENADIDYYSKGVRTCIKNVLKRLN